MITTSIRAARTNCGILAMFGLLLSAPVIAGAQQPAATGAMLSRAELEAQRAHASRGTDTESQAQLAAIDERLRNGDFRSGDRIVVTISSPDAQVDTLAVKADRGLDLPGLAEVSLVGVLRAELRPHLEAEVAKYLRGARVDAVSLVRVSVMGEVVRPGFYSFTSNTPLSDIVMAAGGPTSSANLAKLEIRRAGQIYYGGTVARDMVTAGFTLDDAGLRAGDELLMGKRKSLSQSTVISWITAIGGIVALTTAIAQ